MKYMDKRNKLLIFLRSFFPTKLQIKIEYRIKCKRKLNLKNPSRLSEKLQLYKLNYRNPLMVTCADKIEVLNYIDKKGLMDLIVPKYGIYYSYEEIKFDELPKSFVIKSNHGSGHNIIVDDKDKLDHRLLRKTLNKWLNYNTRLYGTEWVYKKIKPGILIEKKLPLDKNGDLPDYKFFCFNGRVEFLYIMKDTTGNPIQKKLNFYDRDFNLLPFERMDYPGFNNKSIGKPSNFDQMIKYAEELSKDFPHVRVDFYNVDGKIFFGELTFFTSGGYLNFNRDSYDEVLGKLFNLNDL